MFVVPPPAASAWLKSALVTLTVAPVCVQVPFHPPFMLCQPVGQVKFSVQPLMGLVPVLVTSMLATYPLPQSLASTNRTEHVLVAGAPVMNVSGGDAHETLPAVSRVSTFTVYRLPGLRLATLN